VLPIKLSSAAMSRGYMASIIQEEWSRGYDREVLTL
jgi:hypothetical protein